MSYLHASGFSFSLFSGCHGFVTPYSLSVESESMGLGDATRLDRVNVRAFHKHSLEMVIKGSLVTIRFMQAWVWMGCGWKGRMRGSIPQLGATLILAHWAQLDPTLTLKVSPSSTHDSYSSYNDSSSPSSIPPTNHLPKDSFH